MAGLFAEAAFVFVENDSTDGTRRELQQWRAARPATRLILRDGLDLVCPIRTIRLAKARQEYVSVVKAEFGDYDYLFVLDCDEVNSLEIDLAAVTRAIDFLEDAPSRAGVFANADGIYWDMWALRHRQWCPKDAWEEVLDYVVRFGGSDTEAFAQTFAKRIGRIAPGTEPIEVDSAFGGLAVYRVASIIGNGRSFVGHKKRSLPTPQGPIEVGLQICEHVSFNAGFRERGETLFILPYLINQRTPANLMFPPQAFRGLIFDPRLAGVD